ncbi:MAG TPA: type II toxin-antitoxin system RelE/ParE family toxin [Nitrospirae bacterium]|nr:toxin RelG [bacterium BMS3Abin10]GBE39783.1 toxin RelG [bacterium BMS3Bbin08]HDH49895.1 type II toxin-antitoxin system RelE/ParE family toxin [Nitrospirota bacterium]HDK17115.1 type II toxin-antitoxin system RelE/ParE family toxin [Nitrospirota bacterium]HDK81460.1 type II toxin-antitoxin system RelE/ParE family toxin [Nitrospirota bacterium]
MEYKITYKKSVIKDLKKIDKTDLKRLITKIEKELNKKPESYPALKGEFAGLRKLRVGTYRIIYAILNKEVLILRIGHRKEVYL